MGSTVNSEYSEWAYDSARRPGDITLVEYAGGSSESYNSCVALFHDRVRDDAPTADVRHILIGAADANITPTEEQYEQAKAKAEDCLLYTSPLYVPLRFCRQPLSHRPG